MSNTKAMLQLLLQYLNLLSNGEVPFVPIVSNPGYFMPSSVKRDELDFDSRGWA